MLIVCLRLWPPPSRKSLVSSPSAMAHTDLGELKKCKTPTELKSLMLHPCIQKLSPRKNPWKSFGCLAVPWLGQPFGKGLTFVYMDEALYFLAL